MLFESQNIFSERSLHRQFGKKLDSINMKKTWRKETVPVTKVGISFAVGCPIINIYDTRA
jgi:hypothetical protein